MAKKRVSASHKLGLPPGSLVYVGEKKDEPVRITLIDYDATTFEEKEVKSVEEAFPYRDKKTISWINIDGLHQTDILEKIGSHFGVHPLVLEDILNTNQRPKFEEHENHLFVVLKMLRYDERAQQIAGEQVSIVAGGNYLISFQEERGDVFDSVRQRLRGKRVRIRSSGSDYLLYALMDAVVDYYFVILEKLGERIESLERVLMEHPSPEALREIYSLKRELLTLRKSIWPMRELVSGLERSESELVHKDTAIFLRDVYDHTIQVIDTAENYRETVSGLLDMYLSSISNKTNDVMKVLTMIATIFIPLSFIAGLYGMNFDTQASKWNMPELDWHWGYPAVLAVMLAVALGMVVYFKRKKWL